MSLHNIFVVIPAYNEETTVGEVVRRVHSSQPAWADRFTVHRHSVLVVDDGSSDSTAQVAKDAGAMVFRHPINRGLGAALSTGIEGALRLGADIVVTLDADGQHDPEEILQVIQPILDGKAEVVIGSRFVRTTGQQDNRITAVPLSRRLANWCGNFFTWLLFGIWVSDSQSGFRAFSADAASRLQLRTSTMEVSSEIIREIVRLKLKMTEVPITVTYTPYSLSKGQGFVRGLETLWKLIVLKFFR